MIYKGSKRYITGAIVNDKLVYPGLRYLPSNTDNIDTRYEGEKFGFYETKEPRIFYVSKTGTFIATYHAQIKGGNDAPPGLIIVVTRRTDGGKSWDIFYDAAL